MLSKKIKQAMAGSSAIRAMFMEGKEMAARYGAENVYDFSLGNPATPAPEKIKTAIYDILDKEDPLVVHGYMANAGYEEVREAIAENLNERFGTNFHGKNLIMTVGAAGGLNIIFKTILDPGNEVMVFAPYFGEYKSYAANFDAKIVEVMPDEADFMPDLADFERKITKDTRAVIINNPNNPTGTYLAEKDILDFLDKIPPTVMVLFDEAYVEFLEPALRCDSMEIVRLHPNVMVARTFSKAYGLAGARVGYGIAQPGLLSMLNRVRHPFNVNDLSQIAALAALQDQEFVEKTLEVNRKGIKFLSEAFDALGLPYMGLHANFITVKVGPHADDIVQYLLKKGIIVRRMKSYDLPEWIRVSVGTPEQNERFLEVLKEALAKFEETSA